jgi:two-component system nitrate/nitrite response regulator NarL
MAERESSVIRLLIVDDHAMFREGIAALLGREPDFEIVATCATAAEALPVVGAGNLDVILLDYDLGPESAAEFVLEAKNRGFAGRILVVTAGINELEVLQLIRAGVDGVLHKHNSPEILCATVRQVAAGDVCLEKNYLKPLFRTLDQTRSTDKTQLSERDKAILRYVFQGLANKQIGTLLDLSEGAVKACLRQLFHKLGVHTRAQLVKVALERYRDQL